MYRTIATVGVVALLLVSALATPVAAASDAEIEESTLHVDLEADGDATVSLVSVYDLSDPDERDAFESLREDESVQEESLERFVDRLGAVAASVDEEQSVAAESVDVRTDDDRGIVTLSVTWSGLADLEDDTLVLTEPFASGFEPDWTLLVTAPDGSTIESTGTDTATVAETQATWEPGAELSGFEVTVSLADDADETPGFGMTIAVIAVALGVVALLERRT
ncbi:DUF7345 domain-containing protein [Natrialbaceae archaeon A-gly3]